jgi:uncharacterized protein (TIGR03032 family)
MAETAPTAQPKLEVTGSRHFDRWMAEINASLVFTTYQTGKLFFIGMQDNGRLSIFERTIERVMGMHATPEQIWVSTISQLWRFDNLLLPGQLYQGYDRLFAPRESRVTGDIDIHDMAVDADGRLVFINTMFNCLATYDDHHSFRPLWRPPWITRLAPEDRCHLNGLAMRDGRPAYATAVSRSDVVDGWRDRRHDGGVVVNIASGEIVAEGLSMPHSPRWYRDRLWLLNSGTGYFGYIDGQSGRFEPVCFCPGYARGLAFHGKWALIGLSDRRENRTFQGLELENNLARHDAPARCGLLVVDIETGDAPHSVRIEGVVRELFDVSILPGVRRPMVIGFIADDIRKMISIAPEK